MSISETATRPLEDRVLGRLSASRPGPLLLVIAGLHGNEPAGVIAARRVLERLGGSDRGLAGEVVFLAGNRQALATGRRFLAEDLNRIWSDARIEAARNGGSEARPEESELADLSARLEELVAAAPGEVFALDLHSTSGPGPAFAVLDDTLSNRRFALYLPVPVVLGLEEELDGTLATWLLGRGAIIAGFECGQHDDPQSAERGEAAIWIALEASGVLEAGARPEPEWGRKRLADGNSHLPRVVETRYRHPVSPEDRFRPAHDLESFQPVEKGQVVAWDRRGPIAAPLAGRLLMPLFQTQGDDGFFVVRDVRPIWLAVSTGLRRLRAERWLHLLPGVRRKPGERDVFLVDRRVARWFARQIFHLLGYRRQGEAGPELELSRRVEVRRQRRG